MVGAKTGWKHINQKVQIDSLSENRIEYRITVTDNWNRSTTSPILNYTVIFDYSNDITNLKCVENSDGSYTIVDYKTDSGVRPYEHYNQQRCYKEAAKNLVPHDGKISCCLYYLRFDEIVYLPL